MLGRGHLVVAWIGWTNWWYTKTELTSRARRHAATALDFSSTADRRIKERCQTHRNAFNGIKVKATRSDAARKGKSLSVL